MLRTLYRSNLFHDRNTEGALEAASGKPFYQFDEEFKTKMPSKTLKMI